MGTRFALVEGAGVTIITVALFDVGNQCKVLIFVMNIIMNSLILMKDIYQDLQVPSSS